MKEARISPDFPEKYARLYNYQTQKFDAPLNSQGIADVDALFDLAVWTYPDDREQLFTAERDVHHVYGTESYWRDLAASYERPDSVEISKFRDSPPQKAYVPRPLHEWAEYITEWPLVPSIEAIRRRNAAWSAANRLLQGVVLLDKARDDYEQKKDTTRRVLGNVAGITPRSQQKDFSVEELVNNEYWLSELYERLDGWRWTARHLESIPDEDRIIVIPRLTCVRALKRRLKNGALVPRMTEPQAA